MASNMISAVFWVAFWVVLPAILPSAPIVSTFGSLTTTLYARARVLPTKLSFLGEKISSWHRNLQNVSRGFLLCFASC